MLVFCAGCRPRYRTKGWHRGRVGAVVGFHRTSAGVSVQTDGHHAFLVIKLNSKMAPSQATDQSLGLRLLLTSSSAVVSEALTFPIDMTKTRLQLQGEGGASALSTKGACGTALQIVKQEGVVGLYRGLSPAVLRHAFYTSTRIVTYEQLRAAVHQGDASHRPSVASTALLGGISGMLAQIIASPADLVKVRMQADGRLVSSGQPPRYSGIGDAFSKIVNAEGISGLWRGVGPNVQRAFLVNMGELACYDQAKRFTIEQRLAGDNIFGHTIASVMSGLAATILSCPADVVKTRMMNQASQSEGVVYRNSLECLSKTVKAEGVGALWKGFWPTWARLGPWQFVFWISYEQLRRVAGLSSF